MFMDFFLVNIKRIPGTKNLIREICKLSKCGKMYFIEIIETLRMVLWVHLVQQDCYYS